MATPGWFWYFVFCTALNAVFAVQGRLVALHIFAAVVCGFMALFVLADRKRP